MLDLFRAEWRKMTGQRWVVGFLLWIWPIGGALLCLILIAAELMSPATRAQIAQNPFHWTDVGIGAWILPTNIFGRLFIIGFAARMFAGEYQWSTWRNSTPYVSRAALIAVKYITLAALVMLTFVLLSVVLIIGVGVVEIVAGGSYPPALDAVVLRQFIGGYLLQASVTFIGTLIGSAFAAVAAMLTRSILGGVIGGLFFVFAEFGFLTGVTALGLLIGVPGIADLVRFTSTFNIANISSWALYGQPSQSLVQGTRVNSPAESFFILILWLVGLVGATMVIFQRQDLS